MSTINPANSSVTLNSSSVGLNRTQPTESVASTNRWFADCSSPLDGPVISPEPSPESSNNDIEKLVEGILSHVAGFG